jgi:hypothetical protein
MPLIYFEFAIRGDDGISTVKAVKLKWVWKGLGPHGFCRIATIVKSWHSLLLILFNLLPGSV